MHNSTCRRTGGFSLPEIVITLVLVGIMAGIAAPAMGAWTKRTQMRSALDRVTRDIFYARMLAVRSGRQVEVRFTPSTGCATQYEIRILTSPTPRVAKTINVAEEAGGLCVRFPSATGSNLLTFNSRGIGDSRSYWVEYGAMADSLFVSAAGQVRRTP